MTTNDNILKRLSEIYRRINELRTSAPNDPDHVVEILSSVLEDLQASLKLAAANDEMSQNMQLIEAEERFQTAIDFTYYWQTWLDPDGNYNYVSPSCERITGYSANEFMKDPELIGKIVHPDDREFFQRHFQKSDGKTQPVDFRIITRGGEERWISHVCQPVFATDGCYLGRRGNNLDITERVIREKQIAKLTQLYVVLNRVNKTIVRAQDERSLYSQICQIIADEGVFPLVWVGEVNDPQAVPVAWSGPASDYLKEIKVEIQGDLGRGPTGTCIREDRPVINDNFSTNPMTLPWREPALRYGFHASAAFPLHRHGKVVGTFTLYAHEPNAFDEDQVALLESLSSDISYALDALDHKQLRLQAEQALSEAREDLELKVLKRTEELEIINEELRTEIEEHERTERKLLVAMKAAEAAAETKASFMANMSHELRTPMNAVIGYTSLLLDDNLNAENKEFVEGIRKGGEAMMDLINQILDFSRADKQKVELELRPLDLRHCVKEALGLVAIQADQKGLNLTYTVSYGTPDTILGDHGKLRQILVNLLSNAVKFTDEGDISVSISAQNLEENKFQILFKVSDTGIGIPQDKITTIFEPFTQVERVISCKRDGVGLGLAISKRLVELMGGRIWVKSSGQSTAFHFTIQTEAIPGKYSDLGEKIEDATLEGLSELKPLRILVAEDNPSNQKVTVEMLKRLGYRPDAVADGKEVLQALERLPYDLILMDVRMPEMDGITATQVIRKLLPEKGPIIAAVTAYALKGDLENCLAAGMDDYITKPVLMGELVKVLIRCCQKAHK